MRMERRGHAEFDSFDRKVRQGGMIKPAVNRQELRRRIYRKAKAEKQWRFWGLYVHVTKTETLTAAYQEAKANDGSPGIDNVRHHHLLQKLAKRVQDPKVLHLVKQILKANGNKGVPQGEVLSPLLANLYLNELDQAMEEEMIKRRRAGRWERVVYTRYADDMVILVDGYPQWQPHIAMIRSEEHTSELQSRV